MPRAIAPRMSPVPGSTNDENLVRSIADITAAGRRGWLACGYGRDAGARPLFSLAGTAPKRPKRHYRIWCVVIHINSE